MIKKITKQFIAIAPLVIAVNAWALEDLDNENLSEVYGQASLFTTDYIAPGGSNPNTNIGFYRLGLDVEIAMNANIKKFQVGCGGVNGAGVCDIDIDNVRLTGVAASSASDSGPATDFILTRPFFDFAIRNPDIASQREVVGIRFGAAQALGRMSLGENPDPANSADDSGINSISADMNAVITDGTINNVTACVFGTTGTPPSGCVLGFGLDTNATLSYYDYAAQHGGNSIILQRSAVNGCGSTDHPTATNCIFFDGIQAQAALFGLQLTSNLTENLKYIHDLSIDDGSGNPVNDLSMSVQKEAIRWQKVSTGNFTGVVPAQRGWWLSIPQVTVRGLSIDDPVYANALDALAGATVVLRDLDLGQLPADNCYGSLSFC